MATKRESKTLAPEDVFIENQATQLRTVSVPDPSPEPVEYDDVTVLNNVLAELGEDDAGSGFVTVFRETIDASGKKPDEYLERFSASEFSLDNLKSRWGAGKYKISVYQDGRILTRKVITIAKDPNAIAPTAQVQPAMDLSPILAAIQQSNEKMVAAMMTMAQGMQQKGPSRMEMMQEMAMMKEMFTPAPGATPQQFNPVEMMKLGMEMAQGGGGGDGNNSWVNKMLETFGPALAPALAGAVTPQAHAPVPRQIAAPVARPDPLIEQPDTEEASMSIMMTQYLNFLKSAAIKNAPVEEYADSILNSIPESAVSDLEEILRPDNWRDQLRGKTTVADQYPVWFTALRDVLLQYIDEDRADPIVTAHLTPVAGSDSVVTHENANAGNADQPKGDAPSAT